MGALSVRGTSTSAQERSSPVADEDEAIAKANDSAYGLNFSVWTSDGKRGHWVATRLQACRVNVNDERPGGEADPRL